MLLRQRVSKCTVLPPPLCSTYVVQLEVVHIGRVYTPLLSFAISSMRSFTKKRIFYIQFMQQNEQSLPEDA